MKSVAQLLHDYMVFRAGREGVGHSLSVGFYLNALKQGAIKIFGVEVGRKGLISDEQQPDLFAEWTSVKH